MCCDWQQSFQSGKTSVGVTESCHRFSSLSCNITAATAPKVAIASAGRINCHMLPVVPVAGCSDAWMRWSARQIHPPHQRASNHVGFSERQTAAGECIQMQAVMATEAVCRFVVPRGKRVCSARGKQRRRFGSTPGLVTTSRPATQGRRTENRLTNINHKRAKKATCSSGPKPNFTRRSSEKGSNFDPFLFYHHNLGKNFLFSSKTYLAIILQIWFGKIFGIHHVTTKPSIHQSPSIWRAQLQNIPTGTSCTATRAASRV
ncbi:uncharacterized protein LOC129747978 isoform X2 [Uranotaenia lowii]|uniref:uncharacterized protein LOC129747978 isoform X2 n=1 Tax=Uranotaenia lowii TaxID=190385 RepID=UPI002479BEAF|nr:uncharacterized protein LOC129747978 isoform X2 [Uranotaenia lowii]